MMTVPTLASQAESMPQKLLDVLLLGRCSHEFSWPRRAADGQYYQVCLLCAVEFKYDWATMRRTERLQHEAEEAAASSKRRPHARKPTWVPRARRIRLDAPVRYRVKNLGTWSEGTYRFGRLALRLTDDGKCVRGAYSCDPKCDYKPGIPSLADLQWARGEGIIFDLSASMLPGRPAC